MELLYRDLYSQNEKGTNYLILTDKNRNHNLKLHVVYRDGAVQTKELEKAEKSHTEYIKALKEMMFMTSHELRQPVVQILGLSSLIKSTSSHEELIEITGLMKEAAEALDGFTRELTTFIHDEELKAEMISI